MTLDSPPKRSSSRPDADSTVDELLRESLWSQLKEGDKKTEKPADKKDPVVTEEKLSFRGNDIVLKKTDGTPTYYKDGAEEWDSKDGKLWIRRGTNGLHSWRGSVSFDKDGSLVEEGKASGMRYVRAKDGTATTSVTNDKGAEITFKEYKGGKQEFLGSAKWTSTDGNTWRSGSDVYYGQMGIDSFGRFWRQTAGTDKREYADRSRENQRVLEQMNAMEKKFNISFGTPGQQTEYEYKDPEKDAYVKVPITYRFPTFDELNVLQRSLNQYAHVATGADGKADFGGLRLNFIAGSGEGYKVDLYGWYNSKKDGVSQISFAPRNSLQPADGWEGLRGTALHEIGHHLQWKLWERQKYPDSPQKVQEAFNFKWNANTSHYRMTDKDGKEWERHEIRAKNKDTGKWEYRARWYPTAGDTVIKEESRARTGKQMHDALPTEKKPSTLYFTNPAEAHAEALSMYLFDRHMLMDKNSTLYDKVKAWDQEDINKRYGTTKTKDGVTPNMMRAVDGSIVPNTEDARKKVREAESSWRKKGASTSQREQWYESIAARDEVYEDRI